MNSKLSLFRRARVANHLMYATRDPHDHYYKRNEAKPAGYEEPPSPDEIIKIHYLKHYTQWEFQNFEDIPVDSYRYWIRYRIEHYGTESHPAEIHPWERTKLRVGLFYILLPFIMFFVTIPSLKIAHRRKNNKSHTIGVWSQPQI